ncbi:MAG: toll/interleukin-1 receptor domain-containing protein [Clostridia bacterium]|nr:toll/interleukin-1 receptor domain-containing protein [Clostridia bacterium]
MAENREVFKYKTRGNPNLRNKVRVFFACHENDNKYFEEISNEILEKFDVAIFYDDSYKEIDHIDEYKFSLSQMSLVVIPVTYKFLTENSIAYDVVFKYAKENGIPVLPIIYEAGLDGLFAEKCGQIQYLDRFQLDKTAISFDKKLFDFLSGILVDGELAEKIKNSFDAYVFLSYRKKDRMFAQEFMKRVHSNNELRDVAIWYDEFLTPGKNFNNEIEEALKKSKLFALLVTPSIIEPDNYVMNVEYPLALEQNKAIIPAEVVKTDKNELKVFYKKLPEVVDGQNKSVLTNTMISALKNVAFTKNESPEHTYYIALAYQSGIDVEVDRKKAFELLIESAEGGEKKALRKLAVMYRLGDSVKPNIEKEYTLCRELFKRELNDLVKEGIIKIHSDNFEFDANKSLEKLGEFAEIAEEYADVCRRLKNHNEVEKLYKNIQSMYLKLAKVEPQKYIHSLNRSYNHLGTLYADFQNYKQAEEYFLKSFAITKELAKKGDVDLSSLCVAYNNIAICKMSGKDYTGAEDYLLKGLELCKKYNELYKNSNSLKSLANVNKSLGSLYQFLRDLEKSIKYYTEAVTSYKKLAKETEYYLSDLADALQKLAMVHSINRNFKEAEKFSEECFEITKQLAKRCPKAFASKHADSYLALGTLYMGKGDNKKAIEMTEKAKVIYLTLAKSNPKVFEQYVTACDIAILNLKQKL